MVLRLSYKNHGFTPWLPSLVAPGDAGAKGGVKEGREDATRRFVVVGSGFSPLVGLVGLVGVGLVELAELGCID